MIIETLATISADGSTDVEIDTSGYESHPEAVLQIDITGTITIQILGSLDGVSFVELVAAAATDSLNAVVLLPFYRFTASATSGGSAVVKLGRNGVRP